MYSKSTRAIKQFVVHINKHQLPSLLVLVFLITPTATGQTAAFTYQGKLTDGGVSPVTVTPSAALDQRRRVLREPRAASTRRPLAPNERT